MDSLSHYLNLITSKTNANSEYNRKLNTNTIKQQYNSLLAPSENVTLGPLSYSFYKIFSVF